MFRVVFFLMSLVWLATAASQEDLSYTATSIFPRHLVDYTEIGDKAHPFFDQNGFLWNCSYRGLQCFDGEKVTSYNNGLDEETLSITSKGDGYVSGQLINQRYYWAIEQGSHDLICFDVVTRRLLKRLHPPKGKIYYRLQQDEDENLFVVCMTRNHTDKSIYTVSQLDTIHQADLSHPERIKDYAVYNDMHWIRYEGSMHKYDRSGNLLREYGADEAACMYFSKGPPDRLVIHNECTTAAKIYDELGDSLVTINFPPELLEKQYNIYHFGDQIWFVGQQINIKRWDLKTNVVEDYTRAIIEEYQAKENATPVHRLPHVFKDDKGVFYLYGGELIIRLTPKFKTTDDYEVPININKPALSMRATAEDKHGNLYTSFYTGVGVRKKGQDVIKDFRNTTSAPKVKEATYSLTAWDDKLIWNNIIYDLSSEQQDYIVTPEYGHHINHILMGDTLWSFWWLTNKLVKTDLRSGESVVVNEQVYDIPLSVSSFQYDDDTALFWISTGIRGILSFDKLGKVVDHYHVHQLLNLEEGRFINEMYKTDSILWYGTASSLNSFNLNTRKCKYYKSDYISASGIATARAIYSIYPRDDSTFYMGTSMGLVKFDTRTSTMYALDSNHGLASLEFNRNSTFKSSDGRYYFGTVDGLYSFVEDDLEFEEGNETLVPWVYKVEVISNRTDEKRTIVADLGQAVDLVLSADESYVKLSFASPTFEQQSLYSYRLSDVEGDWIATNSTITLPSLQPGTHTIQIRNNTAGDEQSVDYAQINIHKRQYWYKKSWVIALFVVCFFGIVTYIQRWSYQQRLKREKDLTNLRTKISSDLHDDVGSILSGLAMQSEMMTYQVEGSTKSELREISAMSRDAMERMRDTVWTIDSRKDKYENLIDRMRSFAERSLERRKINHTFNVMGINGKRPISPTIRQNVYLIFKEAITNIVKHSDGDDVAIDFSCDAERYRLTIADNGVVNDDAYSSASGLGLSNMQLRASNISAELTLTRDHGFVVTLSYGS